MLIDYNEHRPPNALGGMAPAPGDGEMGDPGEVDGVESIPAPGGPIVDGGGVKLNGEALEPKSYNLEPARLEGAQIQVGKKKFLRLV